MNTATVRTTIDLADLPPLDASQKAELDALSAIAHEAIDTSDIPPLDEAFWRRAVRNPAYKPTKTSTTGGSTRTC